MWQVEYSYDGQVIGDLFEITDGVSWGKQRNTVKEITFDVSLRALAKWCRSKSFDVPRFFTPKKSTVRIINKDGVAVVGGWMPKYPGFNLGASADAIIKLRFVSWLGLTAGAYLIPPLSYNDRFDLVAQQQVDLIVERTFLAGAMWPISFGASDELPVVEGVLEAPKKLMDFLLERSDNTTGTGTFDVYDDPNGVISLHEKYGQDLTVGDNPTIFSYPDLGDKYGLKDLGFPESDDFVSDIFLTGAGNGYNTESGLEGAAIFSEARNEATIAATGYWQEATSESDISDQTTLDDKATSYVRGTDRVYPTLKIDGDRFKVYAHELGGNLWVGDTIGVKVTDWVDRLTPINFPIIARIASVDGVVDGTGHLEITLGLMSNE